MKKIIHLVKLSFQNQEIDFTNISIKSAIFILAMPMIIEMMMESIFAVVDAFYVGRLGDLALATVGLTESVLMIVYSIGMGISMAGTAIIARRFGEKKYKEAGTSAFQLITTGFVLSLLISLISLFFAKDILGLMGATKEIIEFGSGYTQITFGSNVVIVLLFLINGIFRGAGSAQIAMKTLILANGLNLILDPLFIFGWGSWEGFGIEGAAIATVTGRSVGIIYQVYHLINGKKLLKIARENITLKLSEVRHILKIAAGGMGQFLIDSASWIALSRIVAESGESAIAGYTIAFRVIIFTILPSWGLSGAAATLVGQNLGANNPLRAEKSVWITAKYNMLFLGGVMVLFYFFGTNISSLFTSNSETISIANSALTIITFGYVFFGLGMVIVQAFNGAGDTKTPMFINILVLWFMELPFAYYLAIPCDMGPKGVFISIAVCHSIHAIVSLFIFKRGKWKTIK
ncbi:MAG: MATE family efflux transporter, partial [Bacteroidetes bacterium]|nr:MATE family efflux transporter [Bacteroidota bacterium]